MSLLGACGQVIAMSWVDGSPLVPPDRRAGGGADDLPAALAARLAGRVALSPARAEEVRLVRWGVACTLSQLLVTGVMHADTHGGNLLKASASSRRI